MAESTQPTVNLPRTAESYNVSKGVLLAAGTDETNGMPTQATKDANTLPGEKPELKLQAIEVRAKRFYEIGPLPGLGLTKEEIPGNVQSLNAKDIKDAHALSLTDLMNSRLQSVSVNDYQSNPFQMDLNYRGFTASPQLGTAQGISVFLDGIRVNEPFGDVVNWDMLPLNALAGMDIFPGSNPIFGLGTLGGALSMRTKSGFSEPGVNAEIVTGSFGRKQLQASGGWNNGVIAGFLSGNFFLEDGWRDDSPSRVNQLFGKAEWQNEKLRFGLSMLYAGNKLTGNGLLPQQMVDQDPSQVYTSPDVSRNRLMQFQATGTWDVSDTFSITGQIYNRNSKRKTSTADVNENFGGAGADANRSGNVVTDKSSDQQLLPGLSDINQDGRPDYNNYAVNVAADEFGNPLTKSGQICTDPADACVNDLAYGTRFDTPAVIGQGQVDAVDGSGAKVWNWTTDPRVGLEDTNVRSNLPDVFNAPATATYNQLIDAARKNRAIVYATNIDRSGLVYDSPTVHPGTGQPTYNYNPILNPQNVIGGYTDDKGFYNYYYELPVIASTGQTVLGIGQGVYLNGIVTPVKRDANGQIIYRDGKYATLAGLSNATGSADGTPTALFTDTQIDQIGKGASLQFNWNLDKHKFMVGTSIDKADATYDSKQYLGLLDRNRHAYTDPSQLGWEYDKTTADNGFGLNDFAGNSTTKSIYASETWNPIKSLSITTSARFNHTRVNNELAVNNLFRFSSVNDVLRLLQNLQVLCPDTNQNGVAEASECPTGLGTILPFDPNNAAGIGSLIGTSTGETLASMRATEKESFTYRSFNPALGATWQANERLNVYGNISRGARTPTVIELGCAYDDTPIATKFSNGVPVEFRPRSIAEQRTCTLPGAMSGDPYLKQVRSTSMEVGARGALTQDLEWNASLYRTDLQDDIYFVSVNAQSSFFQNIGETRRQGLEMGLKGKMGRASFSLNYSLTDATFQSAFDMLSPHNSSAGNVIDVNERTGEGSYGRIRVNPGNRIPGIPLHNFNANFSYNLTEKWVVSLGAVMHSSIFVRGNENNEHQAGAAKPIVSPYCVDPNTSQQYTCEIPRADFGPGKLPGYAVFNFKTSYKLAPEWTLGLIVNNLFDREYASAGRLGLNAFSPSIRGFVGANGFNYNSSDWQGSSFVGTGAPRAAWVFLSYEFQPQGR
ncbi:TonB-dependent receptor [Methylovorus menthalis]|uniref:TonB-dependent receptor domain-containing protein n=1 Tax=Methylovorus menthalis TaxID=1002227 RepID=UPI001E32D7EE|nr:TonB-dependent receptor [Methylovorus menthalis]MCB4812267.1 TonB-dependent receptor [Methylovorus menthalis]